MVTPHGTVTRAGTTNARDLLWSSNSSVDPPSIVVLNCAPSDPSYVWCLPSPSPASRGAACTYVSRTCCN